MSSSAVVNAVNFIRIHRAQEVADGDMVSLDDMLIARIERLFEHFRLDSKEGWAQVSDLMDARLGYAKSIWVLNSDDRVTEMYFCRGEHL